MFLVVCSRLHPPHKNCYEAEAPKQLILSFWVLSLNRTAASIVASNFYLPKNWKGHQNNRYFLANCEYANKVVIYSFFHFNKTLKLFQFHTKMRGKFIKKEGNKARKNGKYMCTEIEWKKFWQILITTSRVCLL